MPRSLNEISPFLRPAEGASERRFGLDLLRALAILAVMTAHCLYLFEGLLPMVFELHLALAFLGVEAFFVLSGYLVGSIALRAWRESPTLGEIRRFWLRRAWRTLPAYYLFLLIYLGLEWSRMGHPPNFLKHLIFSQNLWGWRGAEFFNISWSLALEEWFYLVFPLLLMAFRSGALAVLCLLVLPIVLRHRYLLDPYLPWDPQVRQSVLPRLDSVAWGTALAYLEIYRPAIWSWLKRWGLIFSVPLLFAAALSLFPEDSFKLGLGARFLFASLSFFFLVPFLSEKGEVTGTGAEAVRAVSLWSYSLYLIHPLVLAALLKGTGPIPALPPESRTLWVLAFFSFSLFFSALVFRYFERPTTALRERWKISRRRSSRLPVLEEDLALMLPSEQ